MGRFGADAVPRACGETRVQGGIYIENGGGNTPIEHFLFCPSLPITDEMGVSDIGSSIFMLPNSDTPHVADMIGQGYYPYPVYWIEETRAYGLSRRVSEQIASQLCSNSMIFVCHRKAYSLSFHQYPHDYGCPKSKKEHIDQKRLDQCIGYFWEDLERDGNDKVHIFRDGDLVNGEPYVDNYQRPGVKSVKVTLPSVEFVAHLRHESIRPDYHKNGAFFAAFPITRLVVVKADDGSHEEKIEKLTESTTLLIDEVEK